MARLFVNTIVFAGTVTVLSLILDSMTAYALARLRFRGRNVVFVVILVMLMMPFQVTLIPLYDMLADLGWTNTLPGLDRAAGDERLRHLLPAPVLPVAAGRPRGGGAHRRRRRVPHLPADHPAAGKPALLTLALFHFMYNWNDLLWPLVIIQSSENQTLPAGLAVFAGQHVVEYGLLMAGSVLALVPIVLFFLLIQRRFVDSMATTGIK